MDFMMAVIIFLVFIFVARIFDTNASKKLTDEKKVQLINLFSKARILNFGILILLVGVYFLALKFELLNQSTSISLYLSVFMCFIIFNAIIAYRKLKSNEFPKAFLKTYLITTSIRILGILVFFGLLLL